jgi:hypothetical protein
MSTQTPFIHGIAGDAVLVCDFFVEFSRFECALKKAGFVMSGSYGNASPAWDEFADTFSEKLDAVKDEEFASAKLFLFQEPPRKQVFVAPKSMRWESNPRRDNESDARYLLRLVRDVRNNLFHGGKYPVTDGGPISDESLRNAKLLIACLTVLNQCRSLDDDVKHFFEETNRE